MSIVWTVCAVVYCFLMWLLYNYDKLDGKKVKNIGIVPFSFSILFFFLGVVGVIFRIFIHNPMSPDEAAAYWIGDNGSILKCAWIAFSHTMSWTCWLSLLSGISFYAFSKLPLLFIRKDDIVVEKPNKILFWIHALIIFLLVYLVYRTGFYSLCKQITNGGNIVYHSKAWFTSLLTTLKQSKSLEPVYYGNDHNDTLRIIIFCIYFGLVSLVVYNVAIWIHHSSDTNNDARYRFIGFPICLIITMLLFIVSFRVVSGFVTLGVIGIAFVLILGVIISVFGGFASGLLGLFRASEAKEAGSAYHLDKKDKNDRIALNILSYDDSYAGADAINKLSKDEDAEDT